MSHSSDKSPPDTSTLALQNDGPYRLLVESVTDCALFMLDPAGNVTSWNAGAERIKGYKAEEVIGGHVSLFYQASDISAGAPERSLRHALAEGPLQEEGLRVRKDGTLFWASVTTTALFDRSNNHIGFANATRDIGDRHSQQDPCKEVQAALQACETRYRTLFEHAQVGIVLADTESYYLDANASACRMLGYSRDELIGLHASDIVARTEIQHIEPALSEITGQSDHHREWHFRRKDGSAFPADVIATLMPNGTLLGIIQDVSDRKRADDYREHLAAIVESSQDAIISIDLNGVVTTWNAGAEAIFGYPAGDILGTSITRLLPDDRRQEEYRLLDTLRTGERVEILEMRQQTRDGRTIDVSVAASPIRDNHGRIVGASKIARDITDLKRQEREIARMSRLYAALSQINQAIVWTTTREELLGKVCRVLVEDGGFLMAWIGWNMPETHQIVPVAQWGDAQGYLDGIKVYSDGRPEGRGPSGKAFRMGRAYICNDMLGDPSTVPWRSEFERRGFRASAAFPIRLNGDACGTLSVYADRTGFFHDKEIALLEEAATDVSFALDNFEREEARRKAERTLRSEKLFSDTMIESMPGVLYFYDDQGRFLRWNRNFETVTGYRGDEIARMHPLDFFRNEDKALLEQRIAEVFEKGESSVEALFVAKDGATTPYFFTGRRIALQDQSCLVGIGIDISERRQAEAEREMRYRAEAADRIKSAFLATMSHELRTPLNSIIGFTGIMLQGLAGPLNPEQDKQLNMVRASARHLLALVNDVLDISKIEAGQLEVAREPFDVRRSIHGVLAIVSPQAEAKHLEMRVHLAPDLGEAVSDERRFEQVVLNLLSNAIKFTDAGEIAVTAEVVREFRCPGAEVDQPAVLVRISDTGMGIRSEDLPTLFQPFRQIDSGLSRKHEGTGLGLAICRRLAVLMGGTIGAESEWGKGSTFSFTLPLQGPVKS